MPLPAWALGCASLIGAVTIAYWRLVPDPSKELGSLSDVDPKLRKAYPEDYWKGSKKANLTAGKTYYAILGPEDGEKIVLVHGLMACWAAMPEFVNDLVAKGYRVLLYDTYGRGYSVAPARKFDSELYSQQLAELMDHVGWNKANIVGYSLGGGISTAFAERHAERVKNLILIAPAGITEELNTLATIVSIPILGSLFAHGPGRGILRRNTEKEKDPRMMRTRDVSKVVIMHHPGFMRAIESTVNYGPIRNMRHSYEKNGRYFKDRILCLWGTADTVVNHEKDMPHFKRLNPEAKIIELEKEDHSIVAKFPDILSNHIHEFIQSHT
ncbi:hypothetical protein HDU97_002905 [Phlyctochytrium planicorne]|nr:hypothetical protein HDU97_002905 [Phlyctochytrium planicorne]